MIQEAFGNRVKELRNMQLNTQEQLSSKTRIERSQLSKIEQGKVNVTLDTIYQISLALERPIAELMDFEIKSVLKPFVKWAGGKTQLLSRLKQLMPKEYNDYYEPFIGGGALFFSVAPKKAFINDCNDELVLVYKCLQDELTYCQFISKLKEYEDNHSEEQYYAIREMDRDVKFNQLSDYIRAARMVYLNKTCFNGLYRVNSKGYFNVPSAKKKKPLLFDCDNINSIRSYFKNNQIIVTKDDFEKVVANAKKGDFVYFDPPYDTWDDKNSFTSYSKDSFGKEEQIRLCNVFKALDKKGVQVMLSNHNTDFISELYKDFNKEIVLAKRMINSKADGRGFVEEVIIRNYK